MPNSPERALARLLLIVFCLVPGYVVAQNLGAMAQDPQWLALLHYGRTANGGFRGESYVDDPRFFLADDGNQDPLSELRKTIDILSGDVERRCRFVARYQWLVHRGLLPPESLGHCREYLEWRRQINAGSVLLVFASSYLNSPSSMYGHTFLRIDPPGGAESPFLSHALNYAATVPPRDNSLLFAWRGMTGGYRGLFTLQPYYEKIQEYSRLENRDMWEYRLNLAAKELDRMMAHVWELRNINFDYYFMDENCSFRLLELLEVARPGLTLTAGFDLHAIPVDTVRAVRDAGLVEGVTYRPSRQRELTTLVDDLDATERAWVLELAEQPVLAQQSRFAQYSPAARRRMLLAAYRLLRYQHNREHRSDRVADNSLALLRAINALPAAQAEQAVPVPTRPDRGHKAALWALAAGENGSHKFTDLDLRLTYHDLLDPVAGHPRWASLNTLRATFRRQESESLRLQSLDVIAIRSLAPRSRFFSPLSWQVKGGAGREFVGADEPLAARLSGGAGGSWSWPGGTVSLLATARLEHNPAFENNWQVAPGLNIINYWQHPTWAGKLELAHYRFGNGVDRQRATLALEKPVGANAGLRLSVSRRLHDSLARNEVSLQWRQHF